MNFLHWEGWAGPCDEIVVTLDHAANIQLLDDMNFSSYRCGRSFRYVGGCYRQSPVVLRPPQNGHWHVAIDLGGSRGAVRAGIRLVKDAA
ncbi:MAG: DUF1883 domain-containing protein [Planctomycetota bacterium]